jgi:hypothetical protein
VYEFDRSLAARCKPFLLDDYLLASPEHHRASLGQLEKDLGLEVSSSRQAGQLIIFEFMRSFFVGSSALVAHLLDLRYTGTNARTLPHARHQC